MPTAKKLRSATSAPEPSSAASPSIDPVVHPTASGIQDEQSPLLKLARDHWLKPTKKSAPVKVKNDVLKKDVWERLEKDGFSYKTLLELEGLSILESYLWPGYTEDASNIHIALVVLVANVRHREHVDTWEIFQDRPADFSSIFRRVLALVLDTGQPLPVRTQLVCFLIHAFQSLDCGMVRKECVPLVSISIWHNLAQDTLREMKLNQGPHVRKAWRASLKRYDAADDGTKARLRFERSWIYTLVLEFISILYSSAPQPGHVTFCERFTEFLCDLQSQLPTRRYINTLLQDLHVLTALKLSPMYSDEENAVLRDMHALLSHYTHFPVDDQTGVQLSGTDSYDLHCGRLACLQRASLLGYKDKLTVLALSNYGAIDTRDQLLVLLEPLTDHELFRLADLLDLRTAYPETVGLALDRAFMMEVFASTFERRKAFRDVAQAANIVPTEASLYDNDSLLRTDAYDGSHPLGLPKLGLQYLSVGDFLWRAFTLYRYEAFYAVKRDIELVVGRLQAGIDSAGSVRFFGSSKMAVPASKPSVLEVVPPLVGEKYPSLVRAEVSYDLRRVSEAGRREWDGLRPDDVVFLLSIRPPAPKSGPGGDTAALSETERLGVLCVRTAEVIQIRDGQGRNVRPGFQLRGSQRKLVIKLDACTYSRDQARAGDDVYGRINVLLRRHSRENNFKRVLEATRALMLSDVPLPRWIHEVFLGYGDPASATYRQLPNRVSRIDSRDTFLDWQHLIESLPGTVIEPDEDVSGSFPPPYVLETAPTSAGGAAGAEPRNSKKRRRDGEPGPAAEVETVKVSTYRPLNCGPYPRDEPKRNTVRFTPAQVEAITSGTQPGLTLVVGPPGTGKTDVATQIISNIYHNFPSQRTLLITHSNRALNQLFGKIVALDIDSRHLLRLGHGEDELETESSFSKHGRVESFLENRNRWLEEVTRLAAGLGAPGAHGNSAETAAYFNSVYIVPAWAKFLPVLGSGQVSGAEIAARFPFHDFFSDAPQPLFPPDADRAAAAEIAIGCYRHICKLFSELADARPFEILRRERDRTNYLLVNSARIIAMTSTHAAMRRGEMAELGFRYDNVVMEEAGQITEAESFIPLAMQRPRHGAAPLLRVVLCGDHLQNAPVIQNGAIRQYANLEQSLFSRLVRLGVPAVKLDQQGRARPAIAGLYRWRYGHVGDLPHVRTEPEFQRANAGFRYDYQFVNVADFRGHGETEPSRHFIQNLGEAEYAVAIYQYMRLLGYPRSKITILTTYAGQRALVRDVLAHRCNKNAIFGTPSCVATVDKYQGEQNDYIILSLTRTRRAGYLRDVRRMTVALSRARLGLYVLGRREVFEGCHELAPAFDQLFRRPDKLMLVAGEMWPSGRILADEEGEGVVVAGETAMEGVEHLGEYVFQMTGARMQQQQHAQQQVRQQQVRQQQVQVPVQMQPAQMQVEQTESTGAAVPPAQENHDVEDEELVQAESSQEADAGEDGVVPGADEMGMEGVEHLGQSAFHVPGTEMQQQAEVEEEGPATAPLGPPDQESGSGGGVVHPRQDDDEDDDEDEEAAKAEALAGVES